MDAVECNKYEFWCWYISPHVFTQPVRVGLGHEHGRLVRVCHYLSRMAAKSLKLRCIHNPRLGLKPSCDDLVTESLKLWDQRLETSALLIGFLVERHSRWGARKA